MSSFKTDEKVEVKIPLEYVLEWTKLYKLAEKIVKNDKKALETYMKMYSGFSARTL